MSMEEIYNDIKQKLLEVRTDIAVNPGSVTSDIFLTPSSYIINKNRVLLDYVQILQSLYTIEALLNNETALAEIAAVELKTVDDVKQDIADFIDRIGDNYNLIRYSATFATGPEFFGRIDPPSSNITIPSGTRVKTLDNKVYATTEEVIMETPGLDLYDASTNLYVVQVTVEAVDEGTDGNAVAGSISQFENVISGLNFVFNKENLANGLDEESNSDFISRIKTKLAGNNFGTKTGYENLIRNNFRFVKDVLVVTAGDDLMTRDNGFGGVCDIYVLIEENPIETKDTVTAFNTSVGGQDGFIFTNQPTDSLIVAPANATYVKDTSGFTGSYASRDAVYFSITPPLSFDVTYTYFDKIREIQEFLQLDENAILGNTLLKANAIEDIALVKTGVKRLINVGMTITILTGFDINVTISGVQTNVLNYINELKLGDGISQSDIVNVVENTSGVDSVNLPLDQFNFITETTAQVNTLTIEDNEYIRVSNVSVTI